MCTTLRNVVMFINYMIFMLKQVSSSRFIQLLEQYSLVRADSALSNEHGEMGKDRVAKQWTLLEDLVYRVFGSVTRRLATFDSEVRWTKRDNLPPTRQEGHAFSILEDLHSGFGVAIFIAENAKADILNVVPSSSTLAKTELTQSRTR
jgi:hypothetical protein